MIVSHRVQMILIFMLRSQLRLMRRTSLILEELLCYQYKSNSKSNAQQSQTEHKLGICIRICFLAFIPLEKLMLGPVKIHSTDNSSA